MEEEETEEEEEEEERRMRSESDSGAEMPHSFPAPSEIINTTHNTLTHSRTRTDERTCTLELTHAQHTYNMLRATPHVRPRSAYDLADCHCCPLLAPSPPQPPSPPGASLLP